MFGAVEGEGHGAGREGGGEFGFGERGAFGGCAFEGNSHERRAVEDGAEGNADNVVARIGDRFDVVKGSIFENGDSLCIVERVCNQSLKLRKTS